MNMYEIVTSASIGGLVGFIASYFQEYLKTKSAKKDAERYWAAMLSVIEYTAQIGLDPNNIFQRRIAKQNDYFRLWYSRANDIWRMIPFMAKNNPSLIDGMMKTHQFITGNLAPLSPSDCDLVSIGGSEEEQKYLSNLQMLLEFLKSPKEKELKLK